MLEKLDLDKREESLRDEIRKLKLELLKHELDDKILKLNLVMEKKNATLSETLGNASNMTDPETDQKGLNSPFESILFANVTEDFEVWHFVVLTLLIWLIVCNLQFLFILIVRDLS